MFGFFRKRVAPTLELDDIQAVVLRERPAPYYGTHALVEINDPAQGREMLRRIRPRLASAADWLEPRPAWTSLGLTYSGLQALGLPAGSLASFPEPFRQGMAARARQLRDTGPNDPRHWQAPFGTGRVHVAITVMAADRRGWEAEVAAYEAHLAEFPGVNVLLRQNFGVEGDVVNVFGYRDLMSQPAVEGSGVEGLPGDGRPIKAGEFVLGYDSEMGGPLPMPMPAELGRNGTFLVFRKYRSHVDAFNRFLKSNTSSDEERELLAAKLVGRWRSGAPLILAPTADDETLAHDPQRNNDFSYKSDERGLTVPLGAHIRRMNPRDANLRTLSDVNIRRMLRRSTSFGTPLAPDVLRDDGQERGLDFIALGVRVMENLEFFQSEWVNSSNFSGLGSQEKDPIIGLQEPDAYFTVPGIPPRRVRNLETFNTLEGGEYFFVPSLSALDWIGGLS